MLEVIAKGGEMLGSLVFSAHANTTTVAPSHYTWLTLRKKVFSASFVLTTMRCRGLSAEMHLRREGKHVIQHGSFIIATYA